VSANTSVTSAEDLIAQLTQKLQYAELKIQLLEEKLRLMRIQKYGPGSEKLSDAQLELLELEPGVSTAEVQAESKREALPRSNGVTARNHPGRQQLPADLPRVETVVPCTAEQRVCPQCRQDRTVIGHEQSEHLDVDPAKYFVRVIKREKYACRKCEELGVVTAPVPPRIIDKSLASS
jgi:transposase